MGIQIYLSDTTPFSFVPMSHDVKVTSDFNTPSGLACKYNRHPATTPFVLVKPVRQWQTPIQECI